MNNNAPAFRYDYDLEAKLWENGKINEANRYAEASQEFNLLIDEKNRLEQEYKGECARARLDVVRAIRERLQEITCDIVVASQNMEDLIADLDEKSAIDVRYELHRSLPKGFEMKTEAPPNKPQDEVIELGDDDVAAMKKSAANYALTLAYDPDFEMKLVEADQIEQAGHYAEYVQELSALLSEEHDLIEGLQVQQKNENPVAKDSITMDRLRELREEIQTARNKMENLIARLDEESRAILRDKLSSCMADRATQLLQVPRFFKAADDEEIALDEKDMLEVQEDHSVVPKTIKMVADYEGESASADGETALDENDLLEVGNIRVAKTVTPPPLPTTETRTKKQGGASWLQRLVKPVAAAAGIAAGMFFGFKTAPQQQKAEAANHKFGESALVVPKAPNEQRATVASIAAQVRGDLATTQFPAKCAEAGAASAGVPKPSPTAQPQRPHATANRTSRRESREETPGLRQRVVESAMALLDTPGENCWDWAKTVYAGAGAKRHTTYQHGNYLKGRTWTDPEFDRNPQNPPEVDSLKPGDWIFVFRGMKMPLDRDGNPVDRRGAHSVIFLRWKDKANRIAEVASYRRAGNQPEVHRVNLNKEPLVFLSRPVPERNTATAVATTAPATTPRAAETRPAKAIESRHYSVVARVELNTDGTYNVVTVWRTGSNNPKDPERLRTTYERLAELSPEVQAFMAKHEAIPSDLPEVTKVWQAPPEQDKAEKIWVAKGRVVGLKNS